MNPQTCSVEDDNETSSQSSRYLLGLVSGQHLLSRASNLELKAAHYVSNDQSRGTVFTGSC